MATTPELSSASSPEATNSPEQLFDSHLESLYGAAAVTVPSKLKDWMRSNELARVEVERLATKDGFAAKFQGVPEKQQQMTDVFMEAYLLDQLRGADSQPSEPVAVDEFIDQSAKSIVAPSTPSAVPAPTTTARVSKSMESARLQREAAKKKNETEKPGISRRLVATAAIAGTLATGGAAVALFGNSENAEAQATAPNLHLTVGQHEIQNSNDFFNGQDPSDLYGLKRSANDFGPESKAGMEGDRQGMLDDWEALLRGRESGPRIMADYAANMQITMPGVPIPHFPGVDALHDAATYDRYEQEIEACAKYLREHPDVAMQLHDTMMKMFGSADISDELKNFEGVDASNYIERDSSKLFWDLSVHEGAEGAPYREVTVTTPDGHTVTLKFKPGCGLQIAYFNAKPLQTVRPVAPVIQPAAINSIPSTSSSYVPVENLPQPPVGQPPVETPPVDTPPVGQPPVDTPPPLNAKPNDINEYQRPGTDATTDSGIGQKPPVIAAPVADAAPPVVQQEVPVQMPNNPLPQIASVSDLPGIKTPISAPRISPSRNSGINVNGNAGDYSSGGSANEGMPGIPN